MLKRIFALVLVLSFMFCMTAFAAGKSAGSDLANLEQAAIAMAPAVGAYEKLRTTFTLVGDRIVSYPNGYGGSYINDDNKLEIKIVEGFINYQVQLEELLADQPVVFVTCCYSLNDLITYQEEATKYAEYLSSSYINQENSVVRLFTTPEKAVELETELMPLVTRSAMQPPYEIIATEDEGFDGKEENWEVAQSRTDGSVVYATTPIYGGDTLGYYKYSNSSSLYTHSTVCITGSFKVNASTIQSNCILTAGHVASTSENLYLNASDSTELGFVYSNYANNCSGDIGVLSYNTNEYRSSSMVCTSNTTTNVLDHYYNRNDVVEGMPVLKYGAASGLTSGQVNGYYGYSYNDVYVIDDLIPVRPVGGSVMNQVGDSGAPVWTVDINGNRILLGIVSGRKYFSEDGKWAMYYTPIKLAVDAGFSPYGLSSISSVVWQEDSE